MIYFVVSIEIALVLFFDMLIQKRSAKKCGFDCSSCKYFPCPAHSCAKKRKELNFFD